MTPPQTGGEEIAGRAVAGPPIVVPADGMRLLREVQIIDEAHAPRRDRLLHEIVRRDGRPARAELLFGAEGANRLPVRRIMLRG